MRAIPVRDPDAAVRTEGREPRMRVLRWMLAGAAIAVAAPDPLDDAAFLPGQFGHVYARGAGQGSRFRHCHLLGGSRENQMSRPRNAAAPPASSKTFISRRASVKSDATFQTTKTSKTASRNFP